MDALKDRLRVVMVCVVLQFGVLAGVPMRPEQIEALMEVMNQPKLAHIISSENDGG